MLTANDLLPTIQKIASSYLDELGSNETDQNNYIFEFLSRTLRKLAGIAYQVKDSDKLTLSQDGYVTFKRDGVEIQDLYAPLTLLNPQGYEVTKRTSFSDDKGWWRDGSNSSVHIKGFSSARPLMQGDYTLKYVAYPKKITEATDAVEFPDAGSLGLSYHCAALIMESLPNHKDLATHFYNLSILHLKSITQASIDSMGRSTGGFRPDTATIDAVYKG